MTKPSVVIADDHCIVLEGLCRVLQSEFNITGTATNGYDLLDQVLRHKPDIAVSDLSMPGLTGLTVLQRLRAAKVRTKFVILTMHCDADLASEACREGAAGYVLKMSAASELPRALWTVLAGQVFIDSLLAPDGALNFVPRRTRAPMAPSVLTEREREVLKLVAEGRMLKEIAVLLHITESTVGFHKYNMMRKLRLRSAAAVTQHAIRTGLIRIDDMPAPHC